jgi:hypothetical protein
MKKPKKKRGARGPAKGEGGRPPSPATERINWRLPVGTVAGIKRLAQADGLTGPAYLAALAGVQNDLALAQVTFIYLKA